jgi:xanthine/uracil permease
MRRSCFRENAGLLALTKVGSRRVIQISAGFMIFFSVFGTVLTLLTNMICTNPYFQHLGISSLLV